MSEEDKEIKISFPLFTFNEEAQLENTLNFHLDEFVNEINKTMSKDKDIIILKKVIERQQKEIEELKGYVCLLELKPKENISKDRIREKIKELSKTQAYKVGLEEYTIKILNELLEE